MPKTIVGKRVRITDGSGLDSGKTGTIVGHHVIKTDIYGIPTNVNYSAYKAIDWRKEVAIRLDNGELTTMFKNRIVYL